MAGGILGTFEWATDPSADVDPLPAAFQRRGWLTDVPPGTGAVNHLAKTMMDALIQLDDGVTNASIPVIINPATDGRWVTYSGNVAKTNVSATTFLPDPAPANGVIGINVGGLVDQNATSGVGFDLVQVQMAYEFTAGSLAVKIYERPFGLAQPWTSTTTLIFPATAPGGAVNTDAISKPILPGKEYMLEIAMGTAAATTDVAIFGVELLFTRNGIV